MIKKFNLFDNAINESGKYEDIKKKYNTLGEYVEHLHSIIEDESTFSSILGEYLKIPTKKYNTKTFKVDDYVLMEYWYNDILTPVKIIDKTGRTYLVSHNIEESEIQNAPDEKITKERIVDHFRETKDNKKEKSVGTDIRISNSVNLLNPYDQMLLVKKLHDEFQVDENSKFELEESKDLSVLSKSGFNSFIKVVSALSLPDIKSDKENCPNDFFIIFISDKLNRERLLEILSRFKSMNQISDIISQSNDPIRIYFGLNYVNSLTMEYGIIKDEKRIVIGNYKITKSGWDKLKSKNSKPLISLQDQISQIDLKDLKKLMKIKKSISNFSPGYFHEKTNPFIENNMLVQGYYGVGKWNNGTITTDSYNQVKSDLKEWILTQKWSNDVVFNVKPEKFWVTIKIKIV